jgi:arylsulfatase A-like enzyme
MPNGKPNILVIFGDDIGIANLSCYSGGLMGYETPNASHVWCAGRARSRLARPPTS